MIENINSIDKKYRGQLGRPCFVVGKEGTNEGYLIDYYYGPYQAPKNNQEWYFEYKDTRYPENGTYANSIDYCKALIKCVLKDVNQWQIGRRVCAIDDDKPIEYVVVKSDLSLGDNIVLELKKVSEVEGNNSGSTPQPSEEKIILKVSVVTMGSTVGSDIIKVYKGTRHINGQSDEEVLLTDGGYDFGEYKSNAIVGCRINILNNTNYLYKITYPDGTTSNSTEVINKVIPLSFTEGGGNYTVNLILKREIGGISTIISGDDGERRVGNIVEGSLSNNGLRYDAINNMPASFNTQVEAINYIVSNFGTTTIGEKNYFIPLEDSTVDETFINDVSNLSKGTVVEETSAFKLNNIYDLSICETVSSKKLEGIILKKSK